jgi:hypothetical protein
MVSSISLADSPSEIYQRRILPLLRSPEASSCSDCHLQGIDLKQFLHSDPQRTFVELRARGWIDVENPEKSKLLEFISKQPEDSSEIQSKVRNAEFDSMKAWLVAAASDPDMLAVPVAKLDDLGFDRELVQHSRVDQVTERFVVAIWSQLERCANCHSPDRNEKHRDKHGESMSWIVPRSPSKTLEQLLEKKLIDMNAPEKSSLRLKAIGEDSHGGGIKFPEDGKTDAIWLAFLHDLAKTRKAEYRSAIELPEPLKPYGWRSGLHLRIVNVPSEWNGRLLQVTLHRQRADGSFTEAPSAWAESRVSAERRSWGNSLSLLSVSGEAGQEQPRTTNLIEQTEILAEGVYEARMVSSQMPEMVRQDSEKTPVVMPVVRRFEIKAPWPLGHSSAKEIDFSSVGSE